MRCQLYIYFNCKLIITIIKILKPIYEESTKEYKAKIKSEESILPLTDN